MILKVRIVTTILRVVGYCKGAQRGHFSARQAQLGWLGVGVGGASGSRGWVGGWSQLRNVLALLLVLLTD